MSQWYTPQFINEATQKDGTPFEADKYNNRWYSVKMAESAGNFLWKAKTKPEVGKPVYGHTEPSQSGKATIFKRDQVPEGTAPGQTTLPTPQASSEAPWDAILKELQEQTRLLKKLAVEPAEDLPDVFPD